jgi:hypothetical protein
MGQDVTNSNGHMTSTSVAALLLPGFHPDGPGIEREVFSRSVVSQMFSMSSDSICALSVIALCMSWNITYLQSSLIRLSWTVKNVLLWACWWTWWIGLPLSFVASFAAIQCFRLAVILMNTWEPTEDRQISQLRLWLGSHVQAPGIFSCGLKAARRHKRIGMTSKMPERSKKLNGFYSWLRILMVNLVAKVIMDASGLSSRNQLPS